MNEENALIRRIVEGDVESFGVLVERYRGPVIRMVRNMAGNSHTGEDISQDVFLRAFKKLGSFDPALSRFSTWLFTIARNLAVNAFRKRAVPTMGSPPDRADHSRPHDRLVRSELHARLDAALDALPVKLRTVFILAEIEGLSQADVAQIEGIEIGTVKSRLSRAREKLRTALGDGDGE